jgi:adenosylcobinamide kinase/adenosylcobinamide-phosphate guanylyltransferase
MISKDGGRHKHDRASPHAEGVLEPSRMAASSPRSDQPRHLPGSDADLPAGASPRLILIGGGARSGKSNFALAYARRLGQRRCFIATAQAFDAEMQTRIARHRAERGGQFETFEEPIELAAAIARAPVEAVLLVDCLTLWLSNLLCADVPHDEILARVDAVTRAAAARTAPTLIVTNEVGLGLVPEHALGRAFRDLTGLAHQRLADVADEIYAALMGVVVRLAPAPLVSFRAREIVGQAGE